MNPWLIALFAFSGGGLIGLLFASLFVVNRDELLRSMAGALRQCSDELADYIANEYQFRDQYPRQQLEYDSSMSIVKFARSLLSEYHQVQS